MDAFSFVFSLFSIVLGMALTEVFGGFGKALQSRRKIHIGWLAPMLGAMVALDVSSFWALAWSVREQLPTRLFVLFCGVMLSGWVAAVSKS